MNRLIPLAIYISISAFVPAAFATSPARIWIEGEPVCTDSFPTKPSEISAYSALPVHTLLFNYLVRQNGPGPTKTKYECNSDNFRYFAEVRGATITVESKYVPSGKAHASVIYDAKSPFSRHGIADVFWPNGKLQAREYYCYGYPVGFHRYFDKTGRLIGIADFTKTDYRIERNHSGAHTFVGEQGGVFHPPPPYYFGFMEGYDLSSSKPRRIRFMSGYPGSQGWSNLDLATSVTTWTREGNQGTITWNSFRGQLINQDSDYVPFGEYFQRDRLQNPGRDPVDSQTEKMLRCPWIDEAMSFAKEHRAFSFPQLSHISDAERMRTPRARYMECIRRPNASCLLEQALEQAKYEENHQETALLGAAAVAIAIEQPQKAIEAMDTILQRTYGFDRYSPHFALPTAIKAEAAKKAGQTALADEFAQRAFDHASAPRPSHEQNNTTMALLEIARPLARSGYVDLARRIRNQMRDSHPAHADEILADIGMAQLNAGRTDEVRAIIAELRTGVRQPQKRPDPARYSGRPPPEEADIRALAMIVQSAIEKGNQEQVTANVQRIEKTLANKGLKAVSESLALMYARLGMVDEAKKHLAAIEYRKAEVTINLAALLCEAGQIESGIALLQSLPGEEASPPSCDSGKKTAELAGSLLRCGQRKEALLKLEFAKALATNTPIPTYCTPATRTTGVLTDSLIEAGELDLAETWNYIIHGRPEQQLKWAYKQAQRGKIDSANKVISRISEQPVVSERPEIRAQLLAVEAEVLSYQGKAKLSNAKLTEAANVARTVSAPTNRAAALEGLARIQTARGELANASKLLDEALADYDLVLTGPTSQPGLIRNAATEGFASLAGDFARIGQFERAQEVAESLMNMPGLFVQRRNAAALANQLEINLLLATRGNEDASTTLSRLQPYPPSISKLIAIDQINRRQAAHPEGREANHAALAQLINAGEYLDRATSDIQRRQMIGIFASWLRNTKDREARQALSELAELSARIASSAWRSRALCELGHTANLINSDSKESLFKEGIRLAEEYKPRFFPLDPPPAGACAYWLNLANEKNAAEHLRNLPMRSIQEYAERTLGVGRWAYSGDLLNNTVSFYESEHGELLVDWLGMFGR